VGADRELVTVLLVHPDVDLHDLVSRTLHDEFRIFAAANGARAMTLFERHRPAVVVLESELGEERVELLFEQMRAREPELRAVFLADQDDPKRALRFAELGIVLPRRRDVERLRVAIRSAAKFRALSEDVAKLKDDAARAGTTTAKRKEMDEAAGPRSQRRSPSLLDPLGSETDLRSQSVEAPPSLGDPRPRGRDDDKSGR
jgi:DNA-binding NtrC family response regulator